MTAAAEAVRDWQAGPRCSDDYPYAAVIDEVRRVGKHFVSDEVVAALRRTRAELGAVQGSPASGWLLRTWLNVVLDKADCRYDYVTYLALPLLPLPDPESDGLVQDAAAALRCRDRLVAALVADAVRFEGHGGQATTAALTGKRIRLGTRVLTPVLRRLGLVDALGGDVDPGEVWRRVETELDDGERRAVTMSMLPVSTVHDEHLFIRVLQAWETTFALVAVDLSAVIDELGEQRVYAAARRLDAATGVLRESAPLFSLLATMRREAFAEFRQFTEGASAIQSYAYKLVESLCRRPELPRLHSIAFASVPDVVQRAVQGQPTVQSQVESLQLVDGVSEPMAQAMEAFAEAIRAWRRTHFSLAVRMLGEQPGTGATAGTPYLKMVRDIPVFTSGGGAG
ncbi:tryptophan 2,3-dioxygenase family protein [Salinispora arenicola]|uniref:tryptophan 2,3-dioxygenase family protein n=1 Tax=Salinispora arenicola TaxID=168697 RepID=UPI000379F16E|nr:tryptophan 2,3-dioxygenase family protein [Salinispora arenicola]